MSAGTFRKVPPSKRPSPSVKKALGSRASIGQNRWVAKSEWVGSSSSEMFARSHREQALDIEVVESPGDLMPWLGAWEGLSDVALESNAFYEPWFVLPALEHLRPVAKVFFVLVFEEDAAAGRRLCGIFPLEERPRYYGLPILGLRLWRHKYCPLCTPIIRADRAAATIKTFLDWLFSSEAGYVTMQFNFIRADGPFRQLLNEALAASGRPVFQDWLYGRALLEPAPDAATFLNAAIPAKKRKELRRVERRLAELGRLEYDSLNATSKAESWISEFLELEASGWKGSRGSAIGSDTSDRRFFEEAALAAHGRGRLMMLALRLDGRAIAMKCNFLSCSGSYAFRIAFDESFRDYSPGVLLELDNIRECHARADIPWMDSCALPGHPMIDHLWRQRRLVEHLTVSTGRSVGDLLVSAKPLLRKAKRAYQQLRGSQE